MYNEMNEQQSFFLLETLVRKNVYISAEVSHFLLLLSVQNLDDENKHFQVP